MRSGLQKRRSVRENTNHINCIISLHIAQVSAFCGVLEWESFLYIYFIFEDYRQCLLKTNKREINTDQNGYELTLVTQI